MKKSTTALVFVLVQLLSFGQNSDWIIAPNFLKFPPGGNLPTTTPLPTDPSGYQGQPATGGQNIITDTEGKIVFFIVDENIYSRKGKLIDVFGDSSPEPLHYHIDGYGTAIVVVPDPKDCNLFHLFSTSEGSSVSLYDSYYAKLRVAYDSEGELTENSGLILNDIQDCESKYINLSEVIGGSFNDVNNTHDEKIRFTVAPKNDNDEFKMFVSNGAKIFVLTIDENGLSYSGNYLDFKLDFNMVENFSERIEIEAIRLSDSNGNYRVGHPISHPSNTGGNRYGIAIYDFTPDGIYIPSSYKFLDYGSDDEFVWQSSFNSTNFRGLEFSPSGNKIFVTHERYLPTAGSTLDYWDITGTPALTPLSNSLDFFSSQIEADVNGELIIPRDNYLAKISTPDGTPSLVIDAISIPYYPGSIWSSDVFSTQPLRLLQNQIDGMDYSMIEPNVYDAVEYEATGAATWKPNTIADTYNNNPLIYGFGSITYIEKELRIKAGSNIRIENMTLKFAPGARLIIENGENGQQGGKLTLLNTVLINDERCDKDSLWLGVEVWGNQNANQGSVFNTTQGVLRMFGTSRIENAHIGALIGKRTVEVIVSIELFDDQCDHPTGEYLDIEVIIPNSYENARSGGIIQANAGAVFHNNPMGVWFKTYSAPSLANNLSFFKATEFSWENVLLENKTPNTHINLESVKGIKVNGCSFLLDDPSLYSEIGQGFGIRARESQFYVDNFCTQLTQVGQPCPNATPSFFQNLSYGVYVTNANALSYEVQNSDFENCRYGIYTTGAENERITKNKFAVRELVNQQTAGIVLSNSTAYIVQENSFFEHDNENVANGDGNSYGVVIHNSGEAPNLVYKNYFSNLKIGGMSQYINGVDDETVSNPSREGLQWKCNSFKSAIYEADLGVNGIIDYNQGYSVAGNLQEAKNHAAGNRFSMHGESPNLFPDHDIKVHPSSPDIQYIYIDANFYRPDNYTASNVTALPAQFNAANVTSTGNICPSLLTRKVIELKQEFADRENDLKLINEKEEYGSSATLLALIDENSASQSTFQTLLNNSPYLSDEVLSAYIQSTPPSGFLKEVLIANSKLSASILDEVMNSSLPNGSKNQVLAAQNGFSSKESAQQSLHYLKSERSDLFNQISSKLLLDTNELATTQGYEEFLKEVGDKQALRRLLDLYIDKGIQPNDTLRTQISSVVCDNYIDLSLIKEDLKTSTAICDGLMENQELVDRLDYIVYDADECVAAKALCLLDFIETAVSVPTFLPLDGPSMIMIPSENSTSSQEYQPLEVKVSMYPNPSTGQVYFDLPDFEEGALQIQLFDVTGKEVYSVNYFNTNGELVDFTSLKKGTYIVRITLGNDYNESHLLQLND